jgi:hypothetical protein
MPPLVRTYKSRLKLQGPVTALPNFSVFQRTKDDILLSSSPSQVLPKGSRLLAIGFTSSSATGGIVTSEESRAGEGAIYICNDRENFSHEWILPLKMGDATVCEKGDGSTCENGGTVDVKVQQQAWGTPWTQRNFLRERWQLDIQRLLGVTFLKPCGDVYPGLLA